MSTCYCDGTAHPFRSDYCGRFPAHDDTTAIEVSRRQRKVKHQPLAVMAYEGIPFVKCSCTNKHKPQSAVWLREHWTGAEDEGIAALKAVVARQREAAREAAS